MGTDARDLNGDCVAVRIEFDEDRDAVEIEDAAFCINRAVRRAHQSSLALEAVAKYTREHASLFTKDKGRPADSAERQRRIVALAAGIDALSVAASDGLAKYEQFEAIPNELHAVGFFPEISLISDVARVFMW